MVAPSKNFTVLPDADVDPDSPLTTDLMTALRDNDIHLEEWLGKNYTAAVDHDHDGVNSKVATAAPPDGSVSRVKLKSTTGAVSTTNAGITTLTMPGGQYGFWPETKISGVPNTPAAQVASGLSNTSYVSQIAMLTGGGSGSPTIYAQQRYVQT